VDEFELIRRFFDRAPPSGLELGIGDDAALLRAGRNAAGEAESLVVATDMLVAGRHFVSAVDPESLGHKALAVNLSDLAAMGARPEAFTLALALPEVNEDWLEAFAGGMFALADRHGCELAGGDTTRGPLTISITALGRVPSGSALRRDHAEPGDDLWVSGALGAAAWATRERLAGRDAALPATARRRLDWPEPRIGLGLALRHLARAAIDLSDGLAGDLGHICERSRVGAQVNWADIPVAGELAALPESERIELALAGGDDYELLFAAAPENRSVLTALGTRGSVALTRIGAIVPGTGVTVLDARGRTVSLARAGFNHFA
jgi:thiamine-monophosphate kinase